MKQNGKRRYNENQMNDLYFPLAEANFVYNFML